MKKTVASAVKFFLQAGRARSSVCLVAFVLLVTAAIGQIIKGFRYPEYDEKGRLKFEISGDEAEVGADGLVRIKNLKMTFYEQGKVMMQVSTPWCIFDRVKRTAVSTADVSAVHSELELTGTGFSWDAQDGRVNVFSNAHVILRGRGAAPAVQGVVQP